jgi:hypothetical protein
MRARSRSCVSKCRPPRAQVVLLLCTLIIVFKILLLYTIYNIVTIIILIIIYMYIIYTYILGTGLETRGVVVVFRLLLVQHRSRIRTFKSCRID